VALVLQEPHTRAAAEALAQARLCFAWDFIRIEAAAALRRRGAKPGPLAAVRQLLDSFQTVAVGAPEFNAVEKLIEKHRLRAADAGHLFALLQVRRLRREVAFVCIDDELVRAARAEGVAVLPYS
jgi:uncharacterized protein with PIN domain